MIAMLGRPLAVLGAQLLLAIALLSASPVLAVAPCANSSFTPHLTCTGFTIEKIDSVPNNGSYREVGNLPYPGNVLNLPALCAVIVKYTSATSNYRFGMFLPTDWNGRVLTVGQGSFAGGINWLEMGQGVKYDNVSGTTGHMAALSTDTGHNSTFNDIDSWVNDIQINDWGWQAMDGTVRMGRTLIEIFYNQSIYKSYYAGCSTGGRQGLRQIQQNQTSFDGLLIGAPAWQTTHLNSWACAIANKSYLMPGTLGANQFRTLAKATRDQCDSLGDRITDNITSFADHCTLNFTLIRCPTGTSGPNCLTESQITVAKAIYDDFETTNGTFMHKGFEPGSEDEWFSLLSPEAMKDFDCKWMKLWVLGLPQSCNYGPQNFTDADFFTARNLNPGRANADQFNLTSFKNRGGKILMYHGLSDGTIPPGSSELYYTNTQEAVGGSPGSNILDFFRYFKVPGMQHCFWTPTQYYPSFGSPYMVDTDVKAPWMFAGAGQASFLGLLGAFTGGAGGAPAGVPGQPKSETHDALRALISWVEVGATKAPDRIVATAWEYRLPLQKKRDRPICAHPNRAFYSSGPENDAASWVCRVPPLPN